MNSNANDMPDKMKQNGFSGSVATNIKALYGVRLFLNICASYLKAKSNNEGDGRQEQGYAYKEPFGPFTESKGTEEFPRFDFQGPSIVQQTTSYDCGFAVVANSMAVVKHLEHVQFVKSNMEGEQHKLHGFRFLLNDNLFSLKPFWDRVMKDAGQRRYETFMHANQLLTHMRQEYIEIVDEIANDSVTDKKLFRALKQVMEEDPAPARKETEASDTDSVVSFHEESDGDEAFLKDDRKPSADERKWSAGGETDAKNRVEAAKAMASLRQKPAVKGPASTKEPAKPPVVALPLHANVSAPNPKRRLPRTDKPRLGKRKSEAAINKAQQSGKKVRQQQNTDMLPDVPDNNKGIHETQPRQPIPKGAMCHAGILCRLEDVNIVLQGKDYNGTVCCKCAQTFHYVCLFQFEGEVYCLSCYKENVVSQCCTETLFEDLLQSEKMEKSASTAPKHTASELVKFVDNFLKEHGLDMSMKEYLKWRKEGQLYARKKPGNNKHRNRAEMFERRKKFVEFAMNNEKYAKIIQLAKEEWLLSTDGVVKALHYKAKEKEFVVAVHYRKGTMVKAHQMTVTDDWVIDTYGKEIANKLIDREEHQQFIQPLDKDGKLVMLKLDDRIITRVKYLPTKYLHYKDGQGNDHVTNKVCAKGIWKGLLEDGTVLPLREEVVTGQFGFRFMEECKRLGTSKFVPIPVGSCRSSVMTCFPELRSDEAPPVKFMQGDIDRCVFSSLASAFHHTAIPDLVRVADILQRKSSRLSGSRKCLHTAMQIVAENVKWLQPRRIPKNFSWENDINNYMFVVGLIEDSTNCCQHAITIFRNWIYDSNEPLALPLSKESLDCCTWDIKDGQIDETSLFVRFRDGWIFEEQGMKKKKVLDMCAAAANVKQA